MGDDGPVRLVVLTDRSRLPDGDLPPVAAAVAAAGADAVLFREKDLGRDQRARLAHLVADALRSGESAGERPCRLIVASDVDLAVEVAADGVHLAVGDPWPDPEARRHLRVGRSCHDRDELRAAVGRADYVTLSPVWETASKPGHGPALGLDGLREACRQVPDLPVVALGGVGPGRAGRCVEAGAAGVAVMGEVMRAADPAGLVAALSAELSAAGSAGSAGPPAQPPRR